MSMAVISAKYEEHEMAELVDKLLIMKPLMDRNIFTTTISSRLVEAKFIYSTQYGTRTRKAH